MNLDEKLKLFYESAIDDATKKSVDIIEEYKKSLQTVYEEHKASAEQKAEVTLNTETQKLIQQKNKALSIENLDFRRRLNEKVNNLKEFIFRDVEDKLKEFMKTPEYEELLIKQIKESLQFARGDEILIYLNPSDEDKKPSLEKKTGAAVTISNIDFMGGTRAVIHEKNILIDRSFLTKLEEEKDIFSL